MSKADELFKECGYYLKETNSYFIEYTKWIDFGQRCLGIMFNLDDKTFYSNDESLGMQELQAINEKCKELGWI